MRARVYLLFLEDGAEDVVCMRRIRASRRWKEISPGGLYVLCADPHCAVPDVSGRISEEQDLDFLHGKGDSDVVGVKGGDPEVLTQLPPHTPLNITICSSQTGV